MVAVFCCYTKLVCLGNLIKACEELFEENPEIVDILEDRSSVIFEKLKMKHLEFGNAIEEALQVIIENSSSW